jgi:hypothetical protein
LYALIKYGLVEVQEDKPARIPIRRWQSCDEIGWGFGAAALPMGWF